MCVPPHRPWPPPLICSGHPKLTPTPLQSLQPYVSFPPAKGCDQTSVSDEKHQILFCMTVMVQSLVLFSGLVSSMCVTSAHTIYLFVPCYCNCLPCPDKFPLLHFPSLCIKSMWSALSLSVPCVSLCAVFSVFLGGVLSFCWSCLVAWHNTNPQTRPVLSPPGSNSWTSSPLLSDNSFGFTLTLITLILRKTC